MADEFRFLEFRVYILAKELHRKVFQLTKLFPRELDYLVSQMRRASLSVVLNIAEGAGKKSDKDFNRFVTISIGSVYEVVACLDVARDITKGDYKELISWYRDLRNQLGSFSKKLKAES